MQRKAWWIGGVVLLALAGVATAVAVTQSGNKKPAEAKNAFKAAVVASDKVRGVADLWTSSI